MHKSRSLLCNAVADSVPKRSRDWSKRPCNPGMTISLVARQHKLSPSLLLRWRKLSGECALSAVGADEEVVPASEVKALYQQIRELRG